MAGVLEAFVGEDAEDVIRGAFGAARPERIVVNQIVDPILGAPRVCSVIATVSDDD